MSRAQLTSTVEQNTGGAVTPFVAGKNKIINGDFGIWQRGTSFSGVAYTADRFDAIWDGSGATRTISQQTFDYSASPAADKLPITGYPSTYFLRYAQTVGGTGATYSAVRQKIEDVKTFAGQTVTLSFWLKADSNRTIPAPALQQIFGSGGSNSVSTVASSLISATTSWQRFSFTIAVPSISGETIGSGSNLQAQLFLPINTTFTVDTWGWQLEAGSVATPFTTATGTFQGELAACQRYYVTLGAGDFYGQYYNSSSQFVLSGRFPVTMRTTPTSTLPSGTITNAVQQVGVANYNASGFSYFAGGANSFSFVGTATGGTIYSPVAWLASNTTSFSAEL
jgi:hypothetical protein